MEVMEPWVKVGTVENRFEGDRISQVLQEAGIAFLIKSFLDTAYDGLYIPQKGWGIVMVSQKHQGGRKAHFRSQENFCEGGRR